MSKMSEAVFIFGAGVAAYTGCALLGDKMNEDGSSPISKTWMYIIWAILIGLYCVGSYLAVINFDRCNTTCCSDSGTSCSTDIIPPGACGWERLSLSVERVNKLRNDYVYLFALVMILNVVWCAGDVSKHAVSKFIALIAVILILISIGLQYAIIFYAGVWWHFLFLIPMTAMVLGGGLITPFVVMMKSNGRRSSKYTS